MTREQFLGVSYLIVRKFPELKFTDIFVSITGGVKNYHICWKQFMDADSYDKHKQYFKDLGLILAGDHAFSVVSNAPETEQYQVVHKFEV